MTSSNSRDLNLLAWDSARLGEAIESLARKARLLPHPVQSPAPPDDLETTDSAALARWVDLVASQLGIEAEPVESSYADAERLVCGVAPAILYLPQDVIASEAKQSPTRDAETLAPHASAGVASSQPFD
ncbi:MAG: hypothetical protein HY327_13200, partial [Chloroflexi bacterium]|nr:hypothetical protein [Chloroflexota bacterium]